MVEGQRSDAQPPLRAYSFELVQADALAFESLPHEIVGWRVVLLYLWIGLGGAAVSVLPVDWVGEEGGWRFWAAMGAAGLLQYGLASLAMSIHTRWRAARRIPRPGRILLLDHVDHLEWREDGTPYFVAVEMIGSVITTATHVFVQSEGRVLILPARAFPDAGDMVAFGAELEERASRLSDGD